VLLNQMASNAYVCVLTTLTWTTINAPDAPTPQALRCHTYVRPILIIPRMGGATQGIIRVGNHAHKLFYQRSPCKSLCARGSLARAPSKNLCARGSLRRGPF
jgi:hypothetical protein